MASVSAVFLLLFLVSVAVSSQQLKHENLISLGSSLFPNTQPTSWPSPSRLFAFGFYPQGNGFAVGIWLAGKPEITVVWTANRDDPPVSSNTTLEFTGDGRLLLRTEQGEEKPITTDWVEGAVSASMHDSGNFVIYNNKSRLLWQSFSYPTDTILGGQNLFYSDELVSSVSTSDHSSGRFYLSMQSDRNLVAYPVNSSGLPEDSYWCTQTFLSKADELNLNREGLLCLRSGNGSNLHTLANSSYSGKNQTILYRATLDSDGNFRLYSHSFDTNSSTVQIEWQAFQNQCEAKVTCGLNSFCSGTGTKVECSCFPGFVFVNSSNNFLGCYRNFIDEEGCRRTEPAIFYNITTADNTILGGKPYTVESTNKENCGKFCLEDCNCAAALYLDGRCKKYKLPLQYGMVDPNDPSTAFFKVPKNPINNVIKGRRTLLVTIVAVSLGSLTCFCSLIAISSFFIYRYQIYCYRKVSQNANLGLAGEFTTLRSFFYSELENATDGFKEELGGGSFGAVYKGTLPGPWPGGNKIVAVKRLEKVVEGEREFIAEMNAIGRTHHKHLVQFLGYCIESSRKLLVYEYMSNGSLADILFKPDRRPIWRERVRIVLQVARGILYLHEECETCIVHCDIKPQNILMDDSWTAKISDFGLAKLLIPNQSRTISGVRGTIGYLAPEWQNTTMISVKADVYSFGIVLLEIVCCRSNMEVNVSTEDEVLLSTWVYNCFVTKDLYRLVEDEEVDMKTLERMVKVGLLCIQGNPSLRPPMKSVILMLEGTMDIPIPPSPVPHVIS